MTERRSRKLVLAVQDPGLRDALGALLQTEGVEIVCRPDVVSQAPEDIEADVIVLRAATLDAEAPPPLLESAGQEDTPGIVVLGNNEDAEEEVRLVAAGATAVLETTGERDELADQLVELAAAEVEGGLQGPEAGGSVAQPKLADFQSRSARMRDFLDMVRRVASSDSTLLIEGETGVGKERLARAIHAESSRAQGPFVTVNCGALAENLLESELFGHERGAFTGATEARKGHFEVASGGTIFLDEIGEMPAHLQVKLLTVLQRHEVQPLGARRARSIDVRVLAATNRDLAADVAEGRFREDLFFRLNVVSLVIPPLRERLEDVPWLVGRFLRHFAEAHGREKVRGISAEAIDTLLAYEWPGNVRELVNTVERAVLLCEGDRIRRADLPEAVFSGHPAFPTTDAAGAVRADAELLELPLQEARRRIVEDFERRYLDHHLRGAGGIVRTVAERAGINPRTLYEKMRRLGLNKEAYR